MALNPIPCQMPGMSAGGPPAGTAFMWFAAAAPDGYLLCDGAAVSRATYADLFAILGTTFGAGDGSTTFALPNLKGRVPVGLDAAQTEFDALGETGGAKTVTLDVNQMPAHTHGQEPHNHAQNSHTHTIPVGATDDTAAPFDRADAGTNASGANATTQTGATTAGNQAATAVNQSAGGGAAHPNLPPYIVVNWVIKT